MTFVKPKKHFGQHFLKDQNIAKNIVDSLSYSTLYNKIVEVGPGTGVLTKFLLKKNGFETWVVELDRESVASLKADFPELGDRIIEGDFLKFNPENYFQGNFAVIGNFPYNISSQILFRVLDFKDQVPEVVGMFQKEVAQRIASRPGSREYGILSVLLKVWYDIDFLFSVPPEVFVPPPKVQSAVISLKRNKVDDLGCDAVLFKQVVKAGFNQRRKTLRNALKSLSGTEGLFSDEIFGKRAEQLGVEEFIRITLILQKEK